MDSLLTTADQKEALSRVYVKALAARAGYATSVPEPDRDSVDSRIQAGGRRRPAIDLQLKASTALAAPNDGVLKVRLSKKNYNDLRLETQTPRLLVVLELPTNNSDWVTVTAEELILRRRTYWLNLQRGHEDVVNQQTITVRIPKHNLLNVDVIRNLMDRSRRGAI